MAKKEKKTMCGSCHGEYTEDKVKMVTLHVNPGVEKNGRYLRVLCESCMNDEFYVNRILETQTPRKLN
jgi:DnaJ-class molecular chaperone